MSHEAVAGSQPQEAGRSAAGHAASRADLPPAPVVVPTPEEIAARIYADQLHELRGVEVIRTGKWNGDAFTEADLDEMVAAFPAAGFRPPVKLGHTENPGDPAYGWVANLRRVGDRLLADFVDLPSSVYEAIRDRRYDAVSSEIFFDLKRAGQTFRRALRAVALLGADIPAVAGLKPLRDTFAGLATGDAAIRTYSLSQEDLMATASTETKAPAAAGGADATPAPAVPTADDHAAKLAEAATKIIALEAKLAEAAAVKPAAQVDDAPLRMAAMSEQIKALETRLAEAEEGKRRERIANKVRDLRIPALREHLTALYDIATSKEARGKVVRFTVEGEARDTDPVAVIDDLVRRLNKQSERLFSELGTAGDLRRDDQPRNEDPGAELDRQARKYAAEHKVGYADAFSAVLADPDNADLRSAYAAGRMVRAAG